jgi:hypothetical protein
MRKGDIVIPSITKVSTCGTIIFQAGHEYIINDVEVHGEAQLIFIDSEWGDWMIDNIELSEKFTYIPIRSKKISSVIDFLKD